MDSVIPCWLGKIERKAKNQIIQHLHSSQFAINIFMNVNITVVLILCLRGIPLWRISMMRLEKASSKYILPSLLKNERTVCKSLCVFISSYVKQHFKSY